MRLGSIAPTLLVLALLNWAPQARAQDPAPTAVLAAYTNQSGSTLYLESVAPNGQITGYYVNRAAGFACQNTPFPVTGWLLGNAITFAVRWQNSSQNCNSVTGWTGYFSANFSTLTTNWNLSVSGSTSILSGSDTFSQTAQTQLPSLVAPQ